MRKIALFVAAAVLLFSLAVLPSVLAVPTYTDQSDNATAYVSDHAVIQVTAKWAPTAAQNLSKWVVSHNQSASWANGTWSGTFESGNWTNGTITTTGFTNERVVFWRIFANDTSGASTGTAVSSSYKFIVDTTEPTYTSQNDNVTTIGAATLVGVWTKWADTGAGLGQWLLSKNTSGAWANGSWTQFGASSWSNTTISTTGLTAGKYGWKIFARDNATGPNVNSTAIIAFTIENTKPAYSSNGQSENRVIVGHGLNIYAKWTDTYMVYQYLFSNNLSGSWANGTWATFSSGNWSNTTIYLSSEGTYAWKIFAKDYSSNMNGTPATTFYAYYSGVVQSGGGGGGSPTLQEEPEEQPAVISTGEEVVPVTTAESANEKIGSFDKNLVYLAVGGVIVYYFVFKGGLKSLKGRGSSRRRPGRR